MRRACYRQGGFTEALQKNLPFELCTGVERYRHSGIWALAYYKEKRRKIFCQQNENIPRPEEP